MNKNNFKLSGYPLLKSLLEKYHKSPSNKGSVFSIKPILSKDELKEKLSHFSLSSSDIEYFSFGLGSGLFISKSPYGPERKIEWKTDSGYLINYIRIDGIESIKEFKKYFYVGKGLLGGNFIGLGRGYLPLEERGYMYDRSSGEFYKKVSKIEYQLFKEFIDKLPKEIDKQYSIHLERLEKKKKEDEKKFKEKEEEKRIKKEKSLKQKQEQYWKDQKRKEVLKKDISDISKEFDTDSDGIIDFNQGQDDFMNLLKKHQVSIIDIDQNHITKFIQVSNYLKIKRENIQKQFEKIKSSKDTYQLKEFTGVLKNQIDTFNLLSYNSMIMIISLVDKDLITFNEIYLTLDKLNIFNSNWENEVSNKLENIGSKLDDLMFSINKMEISITNEILKMSIMNQINMNRLNKSVGQGNIMINDSLKSLNSSLGSNLKSIGSKINLNNLLTGINTYQLYTLNKNTKSLRS